MGAGHFLRSLFDETERKAKEAQDKFNTERQADIDMYRKVMLDPNASPEQRTKAASEIEKLRNIKGKNGPFSHLAGILNTVKGHHGKMQSPPASQEQPQAQTSEHGGGLIPNQNQPQMQPPPSSVGGAKQNVVQRAFDKVGKGLEAAAGIAGRVTGQGKSSSSLPSLDASVFNYPSPAQQQQAQHINEFKQFTDDYEQAFGHKPTQTEIDTHFKLSPAPGKPQIKIEEDPNSPTGRSYVAIDPQTGQKLWSQPNAPKPPSEEPRDTTTNTTDPYGGTTHTETHRELSKDRKKMQPPTGTPGSSIGMKPPPSAQTSPISKPNATTGQPGRESTIVGQPDSWPIGGQKVGPKLDLEGHIPSRAGINERVREAANQLLDGQDVSKISPPSLRSGASMLARQYGWEQGKFTPKEQVMLKETTTFLQDAISNQSLSVLDKGFVDRFRLSQVFKNPDKEGFIGRGLSIASAQSLTPQEQEFVRMYNQLVGTISGMSQLVRSGRATEATIERLKNELPNPATTANSADAKARLQRLMKEIDVAMGKGTFTGQTQDKSTASPKLDEKGKQLFQKYGLPID